MAGTFEQAKDEVARLVAHFRANNDRYLSPAYKETWARQEFIDPFFIALGWDVRNERRVAPQYREVITEDSLDVEGHRKAPDYVFRVGQTNKFFAEAKKPGVAIKSDPAPAYQLRRYAWSAKLPFSILTDFHELAVYDCRRRPRDSDKASIGRIHYIGCEEYPDRFREVWDLFSRDAVWAGSFDRFAQADKGKRGTSEVDAEFLKEIEGWRDVLARNIALRNPQIKTAEELTAVVQRLIDRIVFLRICEDRTIEEYGQLQSLLNGTQVYRRLCEMFYRADHRYNSGLFHFEKEKGRAEPPDEISLLLKIDDKVLKDIIKKGLYFPDSPYEFSVIPADVLGSVYEQFLGKVIRLTAGHQAKVEEKPEVRKAGGVYYTPTYIVEYIVKNTVGKVLEGKAPKDIGNGQPLRALDPACGSGSFLLGAYQYLLDWCLSWYINHDPEKWSTGRSPKLFQGTKGEWRLTTAERKRILLSHIYGVDIDPQAVEVTKLSLLLKVLEGEDERTMARQLELFRERALPDLGDNIKCGNSLIGPDYFTDRLLPDPDELRRINPFDWQHEFPDAIKAGGFDCVIGNPPYVQIENIPSEERQYFTTTYGENGKLGKRYDLYQIFIMRALRLLSHGGALGYIVPNTFLMGHSYAILRRRLVEDTRIVELVDLPQGVFIGVMVDNVLLFVIREPKLEARLSNRIDIHKMNPKSDKARVSAGDWDEQHQLQQADLPREKGFTINVHTNPQQAKLFGKMESVSCRLGDITESSQGIILYKTAADAKRSAHTGFARKAGWEKLLRGKNIARYETKWGAEYVNYGPWLWCQRSERFFSGPKILLHAMRNKSLPRRLVGTLDEEQYYNAHNLANIIARPDSPYLLKYVLGLFNSTVVNFWYRSHFPNVNINPNDFRQIPIPAIDFSKPTEKADHDRMVALVEQMLELHKRLHAAETSAADRELYQRQIDATDREIDRLVYDLYGLSDEEVRIIEADVSQKKNE